ncbi:MAG: MarR family winged helix-turn-helix transcriptional regulator [Bacteroidales bacterium]|nr:MarR family winged helix-turn-helix transcriptional regulator [Bacteroidales bacterium]
MRYQFNPTLGKLSLNVSRGLGRVLEDRFSEKGFHISSDEWTVISHLYNLGSTNQSNLVDLVGRDKVAIKRIIDSLEEKGFVSRVVIQKDKRYRKVMLTLYGEDIYQRLEVIAGQTLGNVLSHIDNHKIETCLEVLEMVNKNLQVA